ncbi:PEP/pyruvate-binding domain-containing protein [Nocardia alni]|uniref:PEP/pyruvate-binding domain-containing protein n=1 Tax=Nocardia alni TaxID=2815723 RepID=UPI001C214740|nr:PEP/pyruvate-binding domain-containing protein [Nocardia alni]
MTILTGEEIRRQRQRGAIRIEPFDESRLNPNSYNFTLDDRLRVYSCHELDARAENPTEEVMIPDAGFVLEAGRLYLAGTAEVLGGTMFAPTFAARSSIARLGLSIHLSSGLGDIGYEGQWTLQLLATQPVRVYPGMEIGQMMWWVPSGEITRYNGKYQDSRGPRASECWRTLDRDIARLRFPGSDGPDLDPACVGAKAAVLARLADRVSVPELIVVPATEFMAALAPATGEEIAAVFSDLHATVGANISEDAARLSTLLNEAELSPRAAELLVVRLAEVFDPETRFAVRSSAAGEDSASSSHAGVYDSFLGVSAPDVAGAVAGVWRSYYSLPAVGTRLRAGDLDPTPRMAVIIQRMIEPDIAGIAMTGLDSAVPDQVQIEAVKGRADELAAGAATPERADILSPEQVADVHRLIDAARAHLAQSAVDIEWALDGDRMYLVQARPNTARHSPSHRSRPAVIGLYDELVPGDIPLGPIGPACAHFVAKRGCAALWATELGIARGAAFVVYIPARPPADWYTVLAAQLDDPLADGRVIVDANEFERQIVTDYARLRLELERIRAATPPEEPVTALVRQYVTGLRGVITRRTAEGTFYGEASVDGLLAMNRGTAGCVEFRFDTTTPAASAIETLGGTTNIGKVVALTEHLQESLGPVAVEWVVDAEGTLYYIDHTVLGTDHHDTPPVSATDVVVIAPGRCVGRVLRVSEDEVLQRLSVAPAVSVSGGVDVTGHRTIADIVARAREIHVTGEQVIVSARRPYAILAALLGHVDGFLFDAGSRLCHLGIILRENAIPAAVHHARNGELMMLDDGLVYSLARTGEPRS